MKAVIQRCAAARVEVGGEVVGQIGQGLAIFLGIAEGDTENCAAKLAAKIAGLRIFSDADDRFNLSLKDIGGRALVVSNFTLCGDARKGTRPSFTSAAAPDEANRLYECFVRLLREQQLTVETGRFAASMQVHVQNDGPVTMILEALPPVTQE